jgi:hypothetical protein
MGKREGCSSGRISGMDEADEAKLKAEIDNIMERVNRIMQDVDGLDAESKETTQKTEE